MPNQFFVIGGRYSDLEFTQIIEGTAHVLGPFNEYDEAQQVWRECSRASRSDATARYAIVTNASNPTQQNKAA